jgi:hypothetical protein
MIEEIPYAIFVVCRRRDLSPRPFDYESNALTKLSYPGALSPFPNVISERIIYSIQGRRLPNFYRQRRDQHGSNYRFWLDHSAHDANLALKTVLSQLVTNGIISMLCFFKPYLSSIDLKFHLSANLSLKEEFDS